MSIASRIPPSRPPKSPDTAAPPVGGPVAPARVGPPAGTPERRRHRRGRFSRLITQPFPIAALQARFGALGRVASRTLSLVAPVLCLAALVWALTDARARRVPTLAPRHRAEALCFALASPPRFAPPMT